MSEFKHYQRSATAELRAYVPGEPFAGISISEQDFMKGSPKLGDMIARNPDNHDDRWLVSAAYFASNFQTTPIQAPSAREGIDPVTKERLALVDMAVKQVRVEIERAVVKHRPMASAHEGWAVIKEELDELWAEVMRDRGGSADACHEAMQVAAMGIRFMCDICRGTVLRDDMRD